MKLYARQGFEWAEDGLVGLWSPVSTGATQSILLDCNSSTSNHGTLTNFSNLNSAWVGSQYGTVLDFDGSNDIVTLSRVANFGKVHTFNCWMKTSDTSYILAGHVSTSNWYAFLQDSGLFYYNAGGSFVNVSGTANDNTWRMISVVRDGTSVSFYKDAVRVGATQTLSANNDLLIEAIGGYNNATVLFAGQIADQSFHARPLPLTEIGDLYRLGPGGAWQDRPRAKRSYFAQITTFKNFWFRNQQRMIGGGIS